MIMRLIILWLLLTVSAPVLASEENTHPNLAFRQVNTAQSSPKSVLSVYSLLGGVALLGLSVAYFWRYRHRAQSIIIDSELEIKIITKKRLSAKSTLFILSDGEKQIWLVEHQQGVSILNINNKSAS